MKKSARKTILRSLTSACFVGTSCCSAILFGQQLVPLKDEPAEESLPPIVSAANMSNSELPPIVSEASSEPDELPPIISAATSNYGELAPIVSATSNEPGELAPIVSAASNEPGELAPIVSAATNEPNSMAPTVSASEYESSVMLPIVQTASAGSNATPPVVSVSEMMANANAPIRTETIQKGANFPTDGERRIADFIQANSNSHSQVTNTGFGTPQQISRPDIPGNDVLMPQIVPAPIIDTAPSIGGQAIVPAQNSSIMQSQPVLQTAVPQQQYVDQYVAPGTDNYFDSGTSASSDYQVDVGVDVDYGSVGSTFDCCGFVCESRNYFIFDTLYWKRNNGVFRASNITFLEDFDNTWGGRITYGTKRDSMRGVEASYMQLDSSIAVSSQFNAPGTLVGALFGNVVGGVLPPDAFTAFNNGTFAEQFHKTKLISAEINRTWWGSDVAKAFVGARYIYLEDEFRLSMANTTGQQGFHSLLHTNNMFGVHCGGEVLYDIGYRLSFSYGGKLGGYANFTENQLLHINNGAVRAFGEIDSNRFSWSGEFGVWTRYKLTPNIRIRAGYEAFGLFRVRTADSAFNTTISTNLNDRPIVVNEAIYAGPSFGFEIYR